MKKIFAVLIVMAIMLSSASPAHAYGWRGYRHPWYGYRGYCAPIPIPAPAPYYRPHYAPVYPPAFSRRWIAPHWRRTYDGDVMVPGHWVRERIY